MHLGAGSGDEGPGSGQPAQQSPREALGLELVVKEGREEAAN